PPEREIVIWAATNVDMVVRAMITVLQRQNVSKRSAPSVHLREPSRGVSWSNIDFSRSAPAPLSRAVLASQTPRKSRVPASRTPGVHRFLQGQLIRGARRRTARNLHHGGPWILRGSAARKAEREARKAEREARKATREARASAGAARTARHGIPWIWRHGTAYSPNGYGLRAERVPAHSRTGYSPNGYSRTQWISRVTAMRGFARAVARRPWLLIGLIIVALALVLFPAFGLAQFPVVQARPVIPAPPDVDQALYGILVPEPAARQQGD